MVGKICGVICVVSFVFGCITGNVTQMGSAVFDGAGKAVTLTLSLVGTMCLWSGVMEVAQKTGVTRLFAKIMAPVLKILFPLVITYTV